jgi:hypothetical protein
MQDLGLKLKPGDIQARITQCILREKGCGLTVWHESNSDPKILQDTRENQKKPAEGL